MRRVLAAVATSVVMLAAAGCADTESGPEPRSMPALGWLAGPGCLTTPQQARTVADGLVTKGLREAGFRSLFVVCDSDGATSALDDPGLRAFLDERGLTLSVIGSGDERARAVVHSQTPLPALRTAITRRVMHAEPLVFDADPSVLDDSRLGVIGKSEAIAIDQDERVTPGAPVLGDLNVLSRAVGDQGLVVSFTNESGSARRMSVKLEDLGLVGDDTVSATDVWSGRRIKARDGKLTMGVESTGSALLRIG